jgi:putrescine transport system permease protein
VVITAFTNGPGSTTLPLYIFSKVRLGVTPDMNALATIIVVLVGSGVAIAGWLMYRADKKRERDVQMAIAANK